MKKPLWITVLSLFVSVHAIAQKDSTKHYTSKEVVYNNAAQQIRLGATVTTPLSKGPYPAVILISGGGQQDRDGNMAGHPMFAAIADYLSNHGYVVLRVDDRGVGKTTGVYDTSSSRDFAADVKAGIAFLQSLSTVDKKEIGLLGHSEGGAVAFMAAANNKDVAFVITLAGLASTGIDAVTWQNLNIVNAAPITPLRKQRFNSLNTTLFATAYEYAAAPDLEQKLRDAFNDWQKTDSVSAKLDTARGHFFFPMESYIRQATGKWYRENIRYDPAIYLSDIHVPILALNGDSDRSVDPVRNLENIRVMSSAAGNKRVTTIVLPRVNHLFQHCNTCTAQESPTLPETIAPEALQQIGAWLKANAHP